VVAHWTLAQVVMGSNPGQVKILLLFHAAAMLLLYSDQRITVPKNVDFFKTYYHTKIV
jgi:hypothetical protein